MKSPGCSHCAGPGRRDFLRVGSLSLLGVSLSQYLELRSVMAAVNKDRPARQAKAQACILLMLEGGPGQMDTWDPKPNSNFKPISTNVAGIRISELFPKVAHHMEKLSIIRSMQTEEVDHPQGTHYVLTGHRPNAAMQFPSLGSIIAKEMGPRRSLPPYVIAPDITTEQHRNYYRSAFLGPRYDPLRLGDPNQPDFRVADLNLPKSISVERIEERRSFLKVWDALYRQKEEIAEYGNLDSFTDQALQMILSPDVRNAFDISREPDKLRDRYGRHPFGQSVLLARRLVESGTRFVTAAGYKASWDTHSNNDKSLRDKLAPPLDQALSTLLWDLDQRGMLESTIVIAMGEFGRTPHINPVLGRDHWPDCWSLILGGGGIQAGQIIGASDDRGAHVAERRVTMGDVFATLYKAFGIDWTKTYMHPIGRPVKIANSIGDKQGVPISGLV